MRIHVLSLFPEMFGSPLAAGVLGRARARGMVEISLHQLRDYAGGRHLQVDDAPYGGGQGMVMMADPLVAVGAVVRLLPGAVGNQASPREDSFAAGLLEHPQYTRPEEFRGARVPDVLITGDHRAIARWRRRESLRVTLARRPELLAR